MIGLYVYRLNTRFRLFTLIFRRRSMLYHMTNYSLDYIVMVYVVLCLHGYEISFLSALIKQE